MSLAYLNYFIIATKSGYSNVDQIIENVNIINRKKKVKSIIATYAFSTLPFILHHTAS